MAPGNHYPLNNKLGKEPRERAPGANLWCVRGLWQDAGSRGEENGMTGPSAGMLATFT
jgi:hypothetical protein